MKCFFYTAEDERRREVAETLPGFRGGATVPSGSLRWCRCPPSSSSSNERFGTRFTQAYQGYFDQLEETMAQDDELQAQAQTNTLENS